MDCPYCGWSLKIKKEWVDLDGYHGILECNSMIDCQVIVNASTNLLWAYENKKIPEHLIKQASSILLSRGMLPTPP